MTRLTFVQVFTLEPGSAYSGLGSFYCYWLLWQLPGHRRLPWRHLTSNGGAVLPGFPPWVSAAPSASSLFSAASRPALDCCPQPVGGCCLLFLAGAVPCFCVSASAILRSQSCRSPAAGPLSRLQPGTSSCPASGNEMFRLFLAHMSPQFF